MARMTAATKRKLKAYKSGRKKPMTKTARAAAARKRIAKLARYPKGHKKKARAWRASVNMQGKHEF